MKSEFGAPDKGDALFVKRCNDLMSWLKEQDYASDPAELLTIINKVNAQITMGAYGVPQAGIQAYRDCTKAYADQAEREISLTGRITGNGEGSLEN